MWFVLVFSILGVNTLEIIKTASLFEVIVWGVVLYHLESRNKELWSAPLTDANAEEVPALAVSKAFLGHCESQEVDTESILISECLCV